MHIRLKTINVQRNDVENVLITLIKSVGRNVVADGFKPRTCQGD